MTQYNRPVYDPKAYHHWRAEGTGEITRHWFRPVCQPDAERRKIPAREQTMLTPPDDGRPVCGLCSSVVNHPAGKGRA